MTAPILPDHVKSPFDAGLKAQRQFRKRKVLPRPRNGPTVDDSPSAVPSACDLLIDTFAFPGFSDSQASSPRTLKHQPRRRGTGPDLPPTPPNCSRASSGSYPAQSSSPSHPDISFQTPQVSSKRPPTTPPDQRSPPTPDVTPPHPASRPRVFRLATFDRGTSRTTTATTDSHTESFKTAREEPLSEDEAAMSAIQSILTSSTPSQATVLRKPVQVSSHTVKPQLSDLALEYSAKHDESYTPWARGELARFDGEWSSPNRVEQEWDDNLGRMVSVGRHRPQTASLMATRVALRESDATEDDVVTATNVTRAVRSLSLQNPAMVDPSPQTTLPKKSFGVDTTHSEPRGNIESRRLSGLSYQSTPSTVVEAILVDNSPIPQRPTLRHVRKRRELRETSPRGRRAFTDAFELRHHALPLPSPLQNGPGRRRDSYASTPSTKPLLSGRARREVWKNGGIPVVVIPDRKSSNKPKSREPSLRSTSSRHSRTKSVGSTPLDQSPLPNEESSFERQSRWDRSTSMPEWSERRTIDIPPHILARSSSLSAPTSRTVSRAGSLTVESLKALNDAHDHATKALPSQIVPAALPTTFVTVQAIPAVPVPVAPTSPVVAAHSPQTSRSEVGGYAAEHFSADHHDDAASAKKFSSRATPFSIVSVETNWTALEVSEAQAVHMYAHQNSSVLMVDHSAKPSDASDSTEKGLKRVESKEPPKITATSPEGNSVTPEQRQSSEEVDSPLRNPRAPPDPPRLPPAINFIPATPSGLTPAHEKAEPTAVFDESDTEKPSRRSSIVRRALSRRRHSIDYPPSASKQAGLLAKTFSLSRTGPKSFDSQRLRSINPDMDPSYGGREDEPMEQDKLHPRWRPQWDYDELCECADCRRGSRMDDEIYRYPLVDNRPRRTKRSLSTKMKQTLAIFPLRAEKQYEADDMNGPQRRTVKRTPSGNLRVMRRRASSDSLKQVMKAHDELRPVLDDSSHRGFWRGHSLRKRPSHGKLRRSSSLSGRLERLPSLTRMWNERRREKRTQELRQIISGPREVRDGVSDVIRNSNIQGLQRAYPDQI
ncbi:uncharacterized protein MAM_05104 [Metarhizium album ARSEF 1941]|uniref:Uncharacterized protein n=1 Tax=Metarhizium album (strain ARSEF 1941) TaxID=1081103 RepID=A0A0B2WVR1_METAS|nr:uncharacterized protein MAM_05104 [Metarhizium album ARSEF 1941]KHN96995.1 hypothetical protein MAM_05104 [Metarhizium album ARSEF 1941]